MYKIIGKEDHLIQKSFFKAAPLKKRNRSKKSVHNDSKDNEE